MQRRLLQLLSQSGNPSSVVNKRLSFSSPAEGDAIAVPGMRARWVALAAI